MCTPGYGITFDRFMRVAHLLPRQRGNVAVDNYRFVNALLWMCRTGAPWRDLPECYGKWITVCRRFNRWSGNGAMERLFTALQEERIIAVEVRVPAMDSTSVKVHQHALGAFMGASLLMDRAYEGDSTRLLAESFGLTPVVPPKKNRTDPWDYDRPALRRGRSVSPVLDNDPFALDAMCAMISAVSKDFYVMCGTGSPAVTIEHRHNPHTRPGVLVSDMAWAG